jgi:MFS family permease
MRWFIPQSFWTGNSIAFWSGLLIPIMKIQQQTTDPDIKDTKAYSKCLYAFVAFGIGQAASGPIMGRLCDKYSSRAGCWVNILSLLIVTGFSVWTLKNNQFDVITVLTCFFWGLHDGLINTHSQLMLGFEFETVSDSFAIFNLI